MFSESKGYARSVGRVSVEGKRDKAKVIRDKHMEKLQ